MQESSSAEGFHSEITGKFLPLTWTESQSLQTVAASNRTEPSPPPWHYESQSVLWLRVCWHSSFGSTKSSPGSDTKSPQWAFQGLQTPPSPALRACWSWWEEHKVLQRNPSLKWNISACSFVVLTNTPSSSINNLFLYVVIISNLTPLSSLPCFMFFFSIPSMSYFILILD